MAQYTYPSNLRRSIQSGRARTTESRFIMSEPASGAGFVQLVRDDVPSYYDLTFTFTRYEALAFLSWLAQDDNAILNGATFDMPIYTEAGVTTQECRFMPDGTPQLTSERNEVFTYSSRVVIRKLANTTVDTLGSSILTATNNAGGTRDVSAAVKGVTG